MELITRVNIGKSAFTIDHGTPMLVVGSCFAQNVGRRLEEGLFDVAVNPAGVIYNPMSIARTLSLVIEGRKIDESELFCCDGIFHSWDFHSSMSSVDPQKAVEKINGSIIEAHELVNRVGVVILTFGSTRYYSLKENGRIVANCHKMPAGMFDLTDATDGEMFEAVDDVIKRLKKINSDVKVIVTVSPVRYKAYGYHESQVMKGRLLMLCDRLVGESDAQYFPSYEIMMDELRDYRYYDEDMIHPSELAVNYIFERFSECYFTELTCRLLKRAGRLTKRVNHRFMTDNVQQAEAFQNETREMARQLETECGQMRRAINKLLK